MTLLDVTTEYKDKCAIRRKSASGAKVELATLLDRFKSQPAGLDLYVTYLEHIGVVQALAQALNYMIVVHDISCVGMHYFALKRSTRSNLHS